MAIQCVTNWASSNTRSAGRIGSFTGTAANQTQAAHTMAVRIRHTSSATNYDSVVFRFANSADQGGSYVGRQTSGAATQLTFYRSNGAFSTFDQVQTTGGYGSTTATVHLALVYDGTTIRPYINGVAGSTVASTNTRVPTSSAGAHAVQIAGQHPGVYSDALFVKRALSAAEVLNLANIRRPDQTILADAIGWYPEWFDDAYADNSGNGNTASNLGTTGTVPAAVNESVPVIWEGQKYWAFFAAPGPTLLPATGTSPSSGSAALSVALPIAATASSPSSGAAGLTVAMPLAGTASSPSSGAVALTLANALAGSGISPSSGAAALTVALPLAGTGSSPSAGSAALNVDLPIAGAGTSPSSGAATLTSALPIAGTATSPSSGVVALTVALPIAATSSSSSSGDATLSQTSGSQLDASATSPSSGSAALTLANALAAQSSSASSGAAALISALPAAGAASSPSSGQAALSLANNLAASGTSPSSGAAAITLANALDAASVSASSGAATLTLTVSLTATSTTSSSGAATLSGVPPPPPSWPNDPAPSRRYFAGYGRRPIR